MRHHLLFAAILCNGTKRKEKKSQVHRHKNVTSQTRPNMLYQETIPIFRRSSSLNLLPNLTRYSTCYNLVFKGTNLSCKCTVKTGQDICLVVQEIPLQLRNILFWSKILFVDTQKLKKMIIILYFIKISVGKKF